LNCRGITPAFAVTAVRPIGQVYMAQLRYGLRRQTGVRVSAKDESIA
jgi:hypothetical protein